MDNKGIIPKWPYFRLVNYCNLPRILGLPWDNINMNGILMGSNGDIFHVSMGSLMVIQ
jgi:hypothetical protein